MINPRVNLGTRALGGLASAIIIIVSIFLGKKFGIKSVDIFGLALLDIVVLFIVYWLVKIALIFIKSK